VSVKKSNRVGDARGGVGVARSKKQEGMSRPGQTGLAARQLGKIGIGGGEGEIWRDRLRHKGKKKKRKEISEVQGPEDRLIGEGKGE